MCEKKGLAERARKKFSQHDICKWQGQRKKDLLCVCARHGELCKERERPFHTQEGVEKSNTEMIKFKTKLKPPAPNHQPMVDCHWKLSWNICTHSIHVFTHLSPICTLSRCLLTKFLHGAQSEVYEECVIGWALILCLGILYYSNISIYIS